VKKQLLVLLWVIPCIVLSQPLRRIEYYNLDSIAKSNIEKIVYHQPPTGILTYNPFWRFKITASVQLNSDVFQNELTVEDYLNICSYDVRARFYITPGLKVFQRVFLTGNNRFYTTGAVLKF
jgi:hypothetical protein